MTRRFKVVGTGLQVRPLLDAVRRMPGLWKLDTWRQEYRGSPHHGTEAIMLRMPREIRPDAMLTGLSAHDWPAYHVLPEARSLVTWLVNATAAKRVGRIMLVKLKPHERIEQHVDEGNYATHHARCHIALSSEEGNAFSCGGEVIRMQAGEAWWFNQKLPHWVVNNTDAPRIHLIVDLVAPQYLELRGDMVTFQREYAWDVWDDLESLVAQDYETRTPAVDAAAVLDRERYLLLEEIGMLRCYTARPGDRRLLACCAFVVKYNTDDSRPIEAVPCVLHVDPVHRASNLGRRLVKYADEQRRAHRRAGPVNGEGPGGLTSPARDDVPYSANIEQEEGAKWPLTTSP